MSARAAFLRWLRAGGGMRPWVRLLAVGAPVLLLCGVLMYSVRVHEMEANLLKSDPDRLTDNVSLANFALSRGAREFQSDCAQCHGASGKGDASLGVPNLTDKDWLYGQGRVSDIRQTVMYGIRAHDPRGHDLADMPAFARPVPYAREKLLPLSPDDINDLISYLLPEKRANDAAAQRGAQIFRGRGGCWDCHGNDARGDDAVGAPNLTDGIWLYGHGSRSDLFQSIADGHAGACPAWINKLAPARILEVSLYVYTLAQNGAHGND